MPSPVPLIFKNVIMDLYMIHVSLLHVKNNNSNDGVVMTKGGTWLSGKSSRIYYSGYHYTDII